MYWHWRRARRPYGVKGYIHTVGYLARTTIWRELFDRQAILSLMVEGVHVFGDRPYGLDLGETAHPVIYTRDWLNDQPRLRLIYEQIAWAYIVRTYGPKVASCNEVALRVVSRDFGETAAANPPFSFLEIMWVMSQLNCRIPGLEELQL